MPDVAKIDTLSIPNSEEPGALIEQTCLDGMTLTEFLYQTDSCHVYQAHDSSTQARATVYEYFPKSLASRDEEGQVSPNANALTQFEGGRRQFVAAGECLAALKNPALPVVEGVWSKNGSSYVQTAHYDGVTLWEYRVERAVHVPQLMLDSWLLACADALTVLTEHGIVHSIPDARHVLVPGSSRAGKLKGLSLPFLCDFHAQSTIETGNWDIYAVASLAYLAVSGQVAPTLAQRRAGAEVPSLVELHGHLYSEQFLRGIEDGLSLDNELQLMTASAWTRALGCQDRSASRAGIVLMDIPKRPAITAKAVVKREPLEMPALSALAEAAEAALFAQVKGLAPSDPAVEQIVVPPDTIRIKPVASPALPLKNAFVLNRRSMRNWRPHLTSAFALAAAIGLYQLAGLRPINNDASAGRSGSLQTALLRATAPDAPSISTALAAKEVMVEKQGASAAVVIAPAIAPAVAPAVLAVAPAAPVTPVVQAAPVLPVLKQANAVAPKVVLAKTPRAAPAVEVLTAVKRVREKVQPMQVALSTEQSVVVPVAHMRLASSQCADLLMRQSLSLGAVSTSHSNKHCQ